MKKELAKAIIGRFIEPKKPTYADFQEVMDAHEGRTFADVKYDGYRVQIHKSSRGFRIFTGNGHELNYKCYPDIISTIEKLPTCIIEAEMIGPGEHHKRAYDNTRRRFRRNGIKEETIERYIDSGIISDVPLSLVVFDTLKFERKGMLFVPYEERRRVTERFQGKGIRPAETEIATSAEELEALVERTLKGDQEGRVCKDPSSFYIPGDRSIDWVKFKRSEPLDLVIVGFYKSEQYCDDLPFTSVLCATYNNGTRRFETIGKIGVTRDRIAEEIHEQIGEHMTDQRPDNVDFSNKLDRRTYEQHVPHSYIEPEKSLVLEVKAMNLNFTDNWQTCGEKNGKAYSMRIGFSQGIRYDKLPWQATTTESVAKLYALQEGRR